MIGYILRRILAAVPLLLGIATIIFIVINLAPGDPTAIFYNPNVPPEVIQQLRENYGLNEPLHVRYLNWMGNFFTGDFGYSFGQHRAVTAVILDTLPNTLILAALSLFLVFIIGVIVGVLQAVRQHSWMDRTLSVASLFFYSMPSFWLGLMLVLIFALKAYEWGLPIALPPTGMTSIGYDFMPPGEQILDRIQHLILPVATLTLVLAAGVARYTRGQMLEVVRQDYIRTARAKGLSERTVIFKHALRNSLIPVVTLLGLYLPFLFSGTVFVETIFAWPGMGRVIVEAIFQRDYPLVMATSFIFAAVVVAGNLVADVLYAAIDPRIRYD